MVKTLRVQVGLLVVNPQILVSITNFEAKTFKEYIEYAKKNPGKLTLGLPTSGGGAPADLDTMAGHIDATVIRPAAMIQRSVG